MTLDELDQLPKDAGIYFAYQVDEVLYVGKSINIFKRWENHHRHEQLRGIDGVRIAWMLFDKDVLTEMERHYIAMFNPPINRTPVGMSAKHLYERKLIEQLGQVTNSDSLELMFAKWSVMILIVIHVLVFVFILLGYPIK